MQLTTHINRLEVQWVSNNRHLHLLEEYVGLMSSEGLGPEMLGSGGDNRDCLDGGEGSGADGASIQECTRLPTPAPRERGLIKEMEEEVREAGLGGWFNRTEEGNAFTESWSGPNSNTLGLPGFGSGH